MPTSKSAVLSVLVRCRLASLTRATVRPECFASERSVGVLRFGAVDPSAPDYDLAAAGRAIAEPARAAMLLRLMDGEAHPAGALAAAAGVSASPASSLLRRLLDAELVSVEVSGRRKLHTLASPEVAMAIEALAAISPLLPVESLRAASTGT